MRSRMPASSRTRQFVGVSCGLAFVAVGFAIFAVVSGAPIAEIAARAVRRGTGRGLSAYLPELADIVWRATLFSALCVPVSVVLVCHLRAALGGRGRALAVGVLLGAVTINDVFRGHVWSTLLTDLDLAADFARAWVPNFVIVGKYTTVSSWFAESTGIVALQALVINTGADMRPFAEERSMNEHVRWPSIARIGVCTSGWVRWIGLAWGSSVAATIAATGAESRVGQGVTIDVMFHNLMGRSSTASTAGVDAARLALVFGVIGLAACVSVLAFMRRRAMEKRAGGTESIILRLSLAGGRFAVGDKHHGIVCMTVNTLTAGLIGALAVAGWIVVLAPLLGSIKVALSGGISGRVGSAWEALSTYFESDRNSSALLRSIAFATAASLVVTCLMAALVLAREMRRTSELFVLVVIGMAWAIPGDVSGLGLSWFGQRVESITGRLPIIVAALVGGAMPWCVALLLMSLRSRPASRGLAAAELIGIPIERAGRILREKRSILAALALFAFCSALNESARSKYVIGVHETLAIQIVGRFGRGIVTVSEDFSVLMAGMTLLTIVTSSILMAATARSAADDA